MKQDAVGGGVLQLVEPVAAAGGGAPPAEERTEGEGERQEHRSSRVLEADQRGDLRLLAGQRPVGVAEAIARPAQRVEAGGLRRLGLALSRPAPRP